MLDLPCVIIAGGKSSRMGSDKALLPFGDFKTLTQYQLALHSKNFSNLHVSCKTREKFDFDASFIEDSDEFGEYSPLIALYSVLKNFRTPVCILSVDTPFVTKEVYERLLNKMGSYDVAIARSPFGSHQLCAIYSPVILPILKEQIQDNNHKIRATLEKVNTIYVDFESDEPFTNLNHPNEYENAQGRL